MPSETPHRLKPRQEGTKRAPLGRVGYEVEREERSLVSDPGGSSLLCSASRREATTGDRSQESPAEAGFLWPLFSSIAPNTSYREPCGLRSSKRVTPCAVVSFSKVATSCIETGGS